MKPTPEHLEAWARAMADWMPPELGPLGQKDYASKWFDIIAPIVLEEAAKAAAFENLEPGTVVSVDVPAKCISSYTQGAKDAAARIRALKAVK